MHAIWSGSISFGLVNIPIKLYSGAEEPRLNLRMLHKKDHSPIRYAKICRSEGKEIPYSEIVKGYEFQKNEYIILDEKDFEKADVRATHTIDIVEFINEKELDLRLIEKPYYLEPNKGAEKAYALLRESLLRAKKIAVAKFVIHNREHLAVLKSMDNVLVLNSIRFVAEIRDVKNLKIPKAEQFKAQEINMALALIRQLSKRFNPHEFQDTYKKELENIIEEKTAGKKPRSRGKKTVNTKAKDLMFVLKASLKQAKDKKEKNNHRTYEKRMAA